MARRITVHHGEVISQSRFPLPFTSSVRCCRECTCCGPKTFTHNAAIVDRHCTIHKDRTSMCNLHRHPTVESRITRWYEQAAQEQRYCSAMFLIPSANSHWVQWYAIPMKTETILAEREARKTKLDHTCSTRQATIDCCVHDASFRPSNTTMQTTNDPHDGVNEDMQEFIHEGRYGLDGPARNVVVISCTFHYGVAPSSFMRHVVRA